MPEIGDGLSLERTEPDLRVKRAFISLGIFAALILWGLWGCSTSQHAQPQFTGEILNQSPAPESVNLRQMLVPAGRYGRHIEFPLTATYITIHSTDNPNATALEHARGMAVGAFRARTKWNRTGYLTWHFTVDDKQAIQSLPLNIQGEHAAEE